VTATLTTVVGESHTFGVVQLNGPCLNDGLCLSTNDGYVLAEGQTSFTLEAGDNPVVTLTLKGVLEAGFMCNVLDTACSYFPGPLAADGYYHYVAFPTDENGSPVIPMVEPAGGWVTTGAWNTAYDNGGWNILLTSGTGVVDLEPENYTANATYPDINPAYGTNPNNTLINFTVPNPIEMNHSGLWWDGEGFKFKCLTTGTATIAMQMAPGSLSKGAVAGFSYTSGNYPAADALLGAVGSYIDFGNGEGMTVNCSGNVVISIQ
jgi:hypothetical protein